MSPIKRSIASLLSISILVLGLQGSLAQAGMIAFQRELLGNIAANTGSGTDHETNGFGHAGFPSLILFPVQYSVDPTEVPRVYIFRSPALRQPAT